MLTIRILRLAPGTAEITLYKEQGFSSNLRDVFSELPKVMTEYFLVKNLNRMQANTPDEGLYQRFMEKFGFKKNAVMRRFNCGVDYILWEYLGGD